MPCVYADLIYTGKEILEKKHLCFESDKISGFSDQPKGEVAAEYKVLAPAFIDAHSHIGLIRAGEPAAEAEANERMDDILSLPDALDSIQMDDQAFKDSIGQGVLYSCVLPGSRNLLSGRSAVVRHWAPDTTSALVARAGIKGAVGYNPISHSDSHPKSPNTRMGAMALLRSKLEEVKRKLESKSEKEDNKALSAEQEALARVLEGSDRYRVHAHKIDDIAALMRLKDEYGLNVGVEHAGDVYRQETFQDLKERGIPLVYGPIDGFAYKVELKHRSTDNVGRLIKSGIEFGLMTDHPVTLSGSLLLQTRWLLKFGYSKEKAIGVITMNNAKALGLDKNLGSLEEGKWASFSGWNGDPFDISSQCVGVYGEGQKLI